MSGQREIQQTIATIDGLVREIETISDPSARSLARQLVQSLMDFHASGIERLLEITHGSGDAGQQIVDAFGRDELASSLLLLYGLHPLDLESRVLNSLEKVSGQLAPHGGSVRLISIADSGAVTVRLEQKGHGCHSSARELSSLVEKAINDGAPDATSITIENADRAAEGFVPLSALQQSRESRVEIERATRDVR